MNFQYVISEVTLHVNMTPLKAEDQLLIKTFRQNEKGWNVGRMIVEFPKETVEMTYAV